MALDVFELRKALADPTFRPKLAKKIRDVIAKNGAEIEQMRQRELGKSVMADAHFEPGKHEPEQAGAPEHMEPGGHEQYAMNPPARPEGQDPIGSGLAVPPGEMNQPSTGGDPCLFCRQNACPGTCRSTAKSEKNPGHNNDPSKRQPSPPVKGAKLAPDKVKAPPAGGSGGLSNPKANPLGKDEVPAAKPPSGKVPGPGKPPTSSTASKPGLVKGAPAPTSAPPPTAPKPSAPAATAPPKPNGTPGGLGHRAPQAPVPAPMAPKPAPAAPGPKLPAAPFK